jgi:hypothetical protein
MTLMTRMGPTIENIHVTGLRVHLTLDCRRAVGDLCVHMPNGTSLQKTCLHVDLWALDYIRNYNLEWELPVQFDVWGRIVWLVLVPPWKTLPSMRSFDRSTNSKDNNMISRSDIDRSSTLTEIVRPICADDVGKFLYQPRPNERTREEVSTTREEVSTTREEVSTTREEVSTTREEVSTTREEVSTTREEVSTTREEVSTTREEVSTTREEVSTTREEVATPQRKDISAPREEEEAGTSRDEVIASQPQPRRMNGVNVIVTRDLSLLKTELKNVLGNFMSQATIDIVQDYYTSACTREFLTTASYLRARSPLSNQVWVR